MRTHSSHNILFATILSAICILFCSSYSAAAAEAKKFVYEKHSPIVLSEDGNTMHEGLPLRITWPDPNPKPIEKKTKISIPNPFLAEADGWTSSFTINYYNNGETDEEGNTCMTFPGDAKGAFAVAAYVWAGIVHSSVPITIKACWASLTRSGPLGYAMAGSFSRNFSGNLRADTWYTAALANALHGSDLDSSDYDFYITYNDDFDWYFGTDGNTPNSEYDLVSIVLHEMAHGLSFGGLMDVVNGDGSWGGGTSSPIIYSTFIVDSLGDYLVEDYTNNSTSLGSALTSNSLFFSGTYAMQENGGSAVRIYAPPAWVSGSSFSHLNSTTYNNTPDELMVPYRALGEAIHDPGYITTGILRDIGWTISTDLVLLTPEVTITDLKTNQPFIFSTTVKNQGFTVSGGTTLRYYRSANSTINPSDIPLGTDSIDGLRGGATSWQYVQSNAPATAGTWYIGACVDDVADESSIINNCSSSIMVTVVTSPDLAVINPIVDNSYLATGQPFSFSVSVKNQGTEPADSSLLTYYLSPNINIDKTDTPIGTDMVAGLNIGTSSAESISIEAPDTPGTYYVGACVDYVVGEYLSSNNCSRGIALTVVSAPDLEITAMVDNSVPLVNDSYSLLATLKNLGDLASGATTLRYFRSTDASITTSDTSQGTQDVSNVGAGSLVRKIMPLFASTSPENYYVGVCVDTVSGEVITENNCTAGIEIHVTESGLPDLSVVSPTVSDSTLGPEQNFRATATVRNQGSAASDSTTVRFYRSTNSTISSFDTVIGSDSVFPLTAGQSLVKSINLTAPRVDGEFYWIGACVNSVADEPTTTNNCSTGVKITVSSIFKNSSFPWSLFMPNFRLHKQKGDGD